MRCLFFLLGLMTASNALACNKLSIQELNDIEFLNSPNQTEVFRVRRAGNSPCSFFLTIDNGSASSFSGRKLQHTSSSSFLPVQACKDAACNSILKHYPEATSAVDVITGSFPSGGPNTIDITFYPRLEPGNYQRFGRYEENFNMRIYQGSITGIRELEDTESFRMGYDMNRSIDLSIVNTGSPFDIAATNRTVNFGALIPGKQSGFDLVVKYNAGYRVLLSSQNNGRMKHLTLANTIPYSLSLGGNTVSLGSSSAVPIMVTQGSGVSPTGGTRLAGVFTIGTVGATAQPGNYQDIITVSVATTE